MICNRKDVQDQMTSVVDNARNIKKCCSYMSLRGYIITTVIYTSLVLLLFGVCLFSRMRRVCL